MPDLPRASNTGQPGVYAIGSGITEDLQWLFRNQPEADTGIDAHVEIVEDGYATGRLLALQIKSGKSYFDQPTDNGWVYRGKLMHLNYWMNYSLPVIIVLYDEDARRGYWQRVTEHQITRTQEGWKMVVTANQVVDKSIERPWTQAALGDNQGLRRLALARPLMVAARDGELIAEVEEWVNKTSGRGTVVLYADERELGRWSFMAGTTDYAVVLPRIFPWASVDVDEDFYSDEEADFYVHAYGTYDSESGDVYYDPELLSSWLEKQSSKGIRPYTDDGEIAYYRLSLTLNELGRAFLELDKYLQSPEAWHPMLVPGGHFTS